MVRECDENLVDAILSLADSITELSESVKGLMTEIYWKTGGKK